MTTGDATTESSEAAVLTAFAAVAAPRTDAMAAATRSGPTTNAAILKPRLPTDEILRLRKNNPPTSKTPSARPEGRSPSAAMIPSVTRMARSSRP
jgi:hypothetical protein